MSFDRAGVIMSSLSRRNQPLQADTAVLGFIRTQPSICKASEESARIPATPCLPVWQNVNVC
jgi:hypothetical protein